MGLGIHALALRPKHFHPRRTPARCGGLGRHHRLDLPQRAFLGANAQSNDIYYAELDAGNKESDRWELNSTRQLTHSIAGIECFNRLEVKQTRQKKTAAWSDFEVHRREKFAFWREKWPTCCFACFYRRTHRLKNRTKAKKST